MTDVRMATVNIGDIKMGTTFSSDSIFDVLNRIIYSYTPPICNLNLITPKYLEVGTYQDILLTYKVYKNTKDLLPTKLINMSPGQLPSIGGEGRVTADGQAKGLVLLPILATTSIFTIKADDGVSSTSASQSVTGVYPYYYGFINKNNLKLETNDIIQLTKVVDYSNLNKINLLGSGYNYYLQDKNYKPVSGIYDSKDSTKTNKIKRIYFLYKIQQLDFWIQMVARGGRSGEEFEVFSLESPVGLKWSKLRNYFVVLLLGIKRNLRLDPLLQHFFISK
jgi:hypothetical protein